MEATSFLGVSAALPPKPLKRYSEQPDLNEEMEREQSERVMTE
jgi:hypothetical protein